MLAAEILDALQLGGQVDGLLPAGDGLGGVLADAAHLQQLLPGGAQDGGRVAEMLEQLPHAHRADVLDQVQRHQGFPGIHAPALTANLGPGQARATLRHIKLACRVVFGTRFAAKLAQDKVLMNISMANQVSKAITTTRRHCGAAALALGLLSGISSPAADIVWTNTAGGNWSVANNWLPHQIPGVSDNAWMTNNGTYTISLSVTTTVANLTLGGASGVQTLNLQGHRQIDPQRLRARQNDQRGPPNERWHAGWPGQPGPQWPPVPGWRHHHRDRSASGWWCLEDHGGWRRAFVSPHVREHRHSELVQWLSEHRERFGDQQRAGSVPRHQQ